MAKMNLVFLPGTLLRSGNNLLLLLSMSLRNWVGGAVRFRRGSRPSWGGRGCCSNLFSSAGAAFVIYILFGVTYVDYHV